MFNIVKHRDFMLADDLPTWRQAEELRLENAATSTSSSSGPISIPAKSRRQRSGRRVKPHRRIVVGSAALGAWTAATPVA
jgi:hypothetical protein